MRRVTPRKRVALTDLEERGGTEKAGGGWVQQYASRYKSRCSTCDVITRAKRRNHRGTSSHATTTTSKVANRPQGQHSSIVARGQTHGARAQVDTTQVRVGCGSRGSWSSVATETCHHQIPEVRWWWRGSDCSRCSSRESGVEAVSRGSVANSTWCPYCHYSIPRIAASAATSFGYALVGCCRCQQRQCVAAAAA